MKRRDALRKLRTICERLDDVGPDFPVAPIRLYLFGSVLRDKDRPEDLDLLFETQRYPDSSGEFLAALVYGRPTPYDRAVQHLRHRMKMVRINELSEGTSPQDWFGYKEMPLDTPVRLIWEKGLDWRQVIEDIETHPVHWDPVSEESRKADLRARAQAVELGDRLLQASDGLGAVRRGIIERRSVPAWMRLAGHFYERQWCEVICSFSIKSSLVQYECIES